VDPVAHPGDRCRCVLGRDDLRRDRPQPGAYAREICEEVAEGLSVALARLQGDERGRRVDVALTKGGAEGDRAAGVTSLRGGDVDWKTTHVVSDGRVDGLILSPAEAAWLQACWNAASPSP
jgi:hypothetical protein